MEPWGTFAAHVGEMRVQVSLAARGRGHQGVVGAVRVGMDPGLRVGVQKRITGPNSYLSVHTPNLIFSGSSPTCTLKGLPAWSSPFLSDLF